MLSVGAGPSFGKRSDRAARCLWSGRSNRWWIAPVDAQFRFATIGRFAWLNLIGEQLLIIRAFDSIG
ncbi:MAG TPA: hypothetical protein VHY10_13100, partial [Xanthobacteraceae bacterium]|nr:hypothetical protein [Xanthobacteraceae bacterium]